MRKCLLALLLPVLVLVTLGTYSRQAPSVSTSVPLRAGLSPSDRVTVDMNQTHLTQALLMYSELTGRTPLPSIAPISQQLDEFFSGYLSRWHLVKLPPRMRSGIEYHRDGLFSVAEVKAHLENLFAANGLVVVPEGKKCFRVFKPTQAERSRD